MNLLIFQNLYEFFRLYFTFLKTFFEKNQCYNRETVDSMTRKILERDVKSSYSNKIRNVMFIFKNFEKKFLVRKK